MDGENKLTFYCDSSRHLVCVPYSIANLHAMAAMLGIKRHWFHGDHYDIPKRRIAEIEKKCVKITTREIVAIARPKVGITFRSPFCETTIGTREYDWNKYAD